ncbi:MAG TPA: FAD/NAD(P)-binding oxidoreductase [Symbiobacteriaceae bacterium]|jgi:sulfide:quinone oxidoreductase
MTKRLVVVGAGTGGLMVANHVARELSEEIKRGEVSVTLVGDRDEYLYQPGLLYVAFDLMRPQELIRKVKDLLVPGVKFVKDRAEKVDPAGRYVQTASGNRVEYDYLVMATGSDLNLDEIPGLREGAHWFYTLDGAIKLREALKNFKGGRLVMAIGLPHKCPVAPLEFTFMFDEWARERGIREKTEFVYTFPINRAHSIENVATWAAPEFDRLGIQLETFFNIETVDPVKKEVSSLEGTTFNYDLLVTIPPHKGDKIGKESGLTDGGTWLACDRHTLQVGGYDNIFVVGDAANLPISKAGSVAHFEAEGVGANLVNLLTGGTAAHLYNGKAFCFIEAGLSKATYLSFDYVNPPTVTPPTQAVHWFKQAYNRIHWMNLKAIV